MDSHLDPSSVAYLVYWGILYETEKVTAGTLLDYLEGKNIKIALGS